MIKWLKRLFAKEKPIEVIKPKRTFNFVKPKRFVNKVFIHCIASDNLNHNSIDIIEQWHIKRGFNEIGYHHFIDFYGDIFEGRSLEKTPASQKNFNRDTISTCLFGLKNFNEDQFDMLRAYCYSINRAYNGKVSFHGHCEVDKNKTCPVFDYKKVLNLDEKGFIISEI